MPTAVLLRPRILTNDVDPSICCIICSQAAFIPASCPACNKLFCKPCLLAAQQQQSNNKPTTVICPMCNTASWGNSVQFNYSLGDAPGLPMNKGVQALVDTLPAQCANRDCDFRANCGLVLQHNNDCPYRYVDCDTCQKRLLFAKLKVCLKKNFIKTKRKYLQEHLQNECMTDCPHCGMPIQTSELKTHELQECTKRSTHCANFIYGCKWQGLAEHLNAHLKTCTISESNQNYGANAAQQQQLSFGSPTGASKKRKRSAAEKQAQQSAHLQTSSKVVVKQQNYVEPVLKQWDPNASDSKNNTFANNYLTVKGQAASGIVLGNFAMYVNGEGAVPSSSYYWEILYDMDLQPKMFGPYFGFGSKPMDVTESLYKFNYCYSCTGTVFIKGKQICVKKPVQKGDTIGFFVDGQKENVLVYVNQAHQYTFEKVPNEIYAAVQPNSSQLTVNFKSQFRG